MVKLKFWTFVVPILNFNLSICLMRPVFGHITLYKIYKQTYTHVTCVTFLIMIYWKVLITFMSVLCVRTFKPIYIYKVFGKDRTNQKCVHPYEVNENRPKIQTLVTHCFREKCKTKSCEVTSGVLKIRFIGILIFAWW